MAAVAQGIYMSRKGNTDAMCAKFTRFDRMYSHQPAAQVQATQSRATGVNTSTLALTRNASNLAWRSSTSPNIMFYADSVKPFLRFHLHGHSHASPYTFTIL